MTSIECDQLLPTTSEVSFYCKLGNCKIMYVHIIHDQSDDIINKQQCMQKTSNRCVKVSFFVPPTTGIIIFPVVKLW